MAHRCSRSVSPPRSLNYRSASTLSHFQSMDTTVDNTDGLSGVNYKTGYISPLRARTMKEYEQQISDLQKENFNLKLRLYFLEEKMEKNFDCDTRKLHEINIQLKIEAELLRKDVEHKEKLLNEAKGNLKRVDEKFQKELDEWKKYFNKKSNTVENDKDNINNEIENVEDESINELYKQAFGSGYHSDYSHSPSQSQTDISESAELENKETLLQDAVNILQRLDKLQQVELSDLRAMSREKQSSLENYVAKLKQQLHQNKCFSSDVKNINEQPVDTIDVLSHCNNNVNTKNDSSQSLKENTSLESKDNTLEICTICGTSIRKLLEKERITMKQQSLKRDKTIQGLTEMVYKKEKELKSLRSKFSQKEIIEQLLRLTKHVITVNSTKPTEFDSICKEVNKIFALLRKYMSFLLKDEQISDDVLKSLEKHFVQWLIEKENKSYSKDDCHLEMISNDTKQELNSLHEAIKEKNNFIQELLNERKQATTENNKSIQNLLTNLKQKDILIQNLQTNLEELKFQMHIDDKLREAENKVTELSKITEKLSKENEELKATNTEIKTDIENISQQKDIELKNVLILHKNELEKLEQQLNDKMEQIIKYQEEQSELKGKYHMAQQEKTSNILNYEKQLQSVKEKLENSKNEVEKLKQSKKDMEKKLQNTYEEKDQQIEEMNKQYKELQNEFVKIESCLSEKNELCNQLKNKLENTTQILDQIQKEKQLKNEEMERIKLEYKNFQEITLEAKNKEIEEMKKLLYDKMLLSDALNVELQLKESLVDQLQEDLDENHLNRKSNIINLKEHTKKMNLENAYSLNKTVTASNLKRYSLPTHIHSLEKLGISSLHYSKLLSESLSKFGHSDNPFELKEEICFLVLRIEALEQQIQECNNGIGSKLSILSGLSGTLPDYVLNQTVKTWNVLHEHIEDLAQFLEYLLRFDSDGQLDTSLLTQNNLKKLKKYLSESKELSQILSASLAGGESLILDNTLDLEPSKDVGRFKDWLEIEKIGDEKSENLKNQMAECHAALQNKVLECHNLVQTKEILEKELSECQDELVLCREMLEELKTQLEEKDKDYQKLFKEKEQLEAQEKANRQLHEEVHKKLITLSSFVENMQKKLSEEEEKISILSLEKYELKQQLDTKIKENVQFQDRNIQLQKEIEERKICKDCQELKFKIDHLEQNYCHIQSELTDHINSKRELLKQQTLFEREAYCKEAQVKELEQMIKNLEKEIKDKQIIWEKKENESLKQMNILEIERDEFQQKLLNTEKQLIEVNNFCVVLKTELNKYNNMKNDNNKTELLSEMQQLRKELARSVYSNKKLRHKMEQLQKKENTQSDVGTHINEESITEEHKQSCSSDKIHCASKSAFDQIKPITENNKIKWRSYENLSNKTAETAYPTTRYFPEKLQFNSKTSVVSPQLIITDQTSTNIEDSRGQRSHYTSPDLGIDSDPTHDFIEQKILKPSVQAWEANFSPDFLNISAISPTKITDHKQLVTNEVLSDSLQKMQKDQGLPDWAGQILYAVSQLQDYELLKKEIEESLILIKGIQARIKDRLVTFSTKSSPSKSLEYSTLKEVDKSCMNMEVYLEEACHLIGSFWITTMLQKCIEPTNDKTDNLKQNVLLSEELASMKQQLAVRTKELQDAKDQINAAHHRKEKMERAITSQLVKTRQVLKEAKGNLTEKQYYKTNRGPSSKVQPTRSK